MADNDQNNDEYKFAELDSLDNDSMSGTEPSPKSSGQFSERKNVKRNALIAIGLVIFAMVAYKLISMIFSAKSNTASTQTTITPIAQVTPQPIATSTIIPSSTTITTTTTSAPVVQETQPIINTTETTNISQKVSAIELSQQSVKEEISSVGQQIGTVSNNINNLNAQIANLNQVIGNLSTQVTKQSEELSMLRARSQPKPVKKINHSIRVERVIYYIQAVIPGRAWLIGTNGSTLTVREGTRVAGYGIVKLIDSMQGRILTSSGQVIRFSQEDS